ncbi:unnamed protein product [Paramecium primaurelia]|uniref:Uncharacterized protein n=2 Tax=Paramecium TaxID=5884 RepID=A0A8S1X2C1_9CILI|nr:unnamed protein product [Paramecium primaurelia]CAD8195077.1 unnamed protein product [Paramecium pentaurelia]
MATFQERFKGKTSVMGRNGLESVLNTCQQPIKKELDYQNKPPPMYQPLQQQTNIQISPIKIQYNKQTNNQTLYQHNPYIGEQQILDSLQYLSQQQYFQPIANYQVSTEPQKKEDNRSKSAKQQLDSADESQRYKPYTIKDYEIMKKTANAKLGGLGPNLSGEEWAKDKEKVLKRQEFAEQVRQFNSTNIITTRIKEPKQSEPNARTKAMDFARNIPKPQPRKKEDQVVKNTPNKTSDNTNNISRDPFDDEIARLEREHLKYLNQLDKMK